METRPVALKNHREVRCLAGKVGKEVSLQDGPRANFLFLSYYLFGPLVSFVVGLF